MSDNLDFFVSYTRADLKWAEWIAWQLEVAGYSVRIQAWDFRPGESFLHHMQSALESARHILAVYSPEYFASGFASEEWKSALASDVTGKDRRLIPVRVQPCQPPGMLAHRIYIDLVDLSSEADALQALLSGIQPTNRPTAAPTFPGGGCTPKGQTQYPGSAGVSAVPVPSASVRTYANKYEMAGSYWRRLSADATLTFTLLGRSNKSWIGRSGTQDRQLAQDLVRVASNHGSCIVFSDPDENTRNRILVFFHEHVRPLVAPLQDDLRRVVELSIRYLVTNGNSHYQAVRADGTIVVLPLLNSPPFREESMVFEIERRVHPAQFEAYADDLDRLASDSEAVDWVWK